MLDENFYLLFMAFELWSTNAEANPGSRCLGCMVARRTGVCAQQQNTAGLRYRAAARGGKKSVTTHNGTQTGHGLEKALLKCKNVFEESFYALDSGKQLLLRM
jgi:hypothetical protein